MPNRIFTLEEASALLPRVRERTLRAIEAIGALEEDGDEADTARLEQAAEEIFRTWAGELAELGIEVKGPWLVDFDSGAGYYCWKWPEPALAYFHSYEEGFAGRVQLQ